MFWLSSASIGINPDEAVFIGCGSGVQVGPENNLDSLEANIIVVWSEDKASKVVLISVDTLFLGNHVSEKIASGLSGLFKQDEIFLAASHTHSAPMIDETKPRLGIRNEGYAEWVIERIVLAVMSLATVNPVPVTIRKYTANLGGIVERRKKRLFELSRFGVKWRPTLQRPNLRRKDVGARATIAEFLSSKGAVISAVAVVPCHPVALMGRESISADFVGRLRTKYRNKICLSDETPFVFLQGASGDLNPWWKSRWLDEGPLKVFDQLVNGVRFSSRPFSEEELQSWCELRLSELESDRTRHLQNGVMDTGSKSLSCSLYRVPLADLLEEAKSLTTRFFDVHQLQIGDLVLIGFSAEVTSKLQAQMKQQLGDAELVGCIRDSFGYATSSEQYFEGGYEAEGHQWYFSISHFREDSPGPMIQKKLEKIKINSA